VVALASAAAVAIENARLHLRVREMALLEDRERIARDLHDTVIQQLFATGMSLQATAQRTTDPRTADRIQGAVDCLDGIIRDIRAAVFALNTTALDDGGIRGALRDIVAQMLESSELSVELHVDGPVETAIDEDVRQHVIATVREGLSNVNRHAKADRVDIYLNAGSELVLRIVDDGVGIDAQPRGHKGGLSNLKARAESLGGRMTLSQPATGGTALEWRVPWGRRGGAGSQ
jgi:signal transduction histidine kinase